MKGLSILDLKSATASAAATVMLSLPILPAAGSTVDTRPVSDTPGLFDFWVQVPAMESRPAPRAQRLTRAVREWTGWSHRRLATVLDSTHPTVAALEQGRSMGRAGDLFERLLEVHEVVHRVFLVADRDASEVDRLLESPSQSGATATELLTVRKPAEAYLAALDVSRPRRVGPLMQGLWPSKVGEATADPAAFV